MIVLVARLLEAYVVVLILIYDLQYTHYPEIIVAPEKFAFFTNCKLFDSCFNF